MVGLYYENDQFISDIKRSMYMKTTYFLLKGLALIVSQRGIFNQFQEVSVGVNILCPLLSMRETNVCLFAWKILYAKLLIMEKDC